MSNSLVKSSKRIRETLHERIKELKLTYTDIVKDAKERGQNLSIASLSKYFSQYEKNNLSEPAVLWLCYRYGIFVTLHIGVPSIVENKMKFTIPPYDEQTCLKLLKIAFSDVSKKTKKSTKKVVKQ